MTDQNIEGLFEDKARAGDGSFAVAYAILQLAREQKRVGQEIGRLGLGDAATPWGALELISKTMEDGFNAIAASISEVG